MNNKITMDSISFELSGLISVLTLMLEAMDKDYIACGAGCNPLLPNRFCNLYYPCVARTLSSLSDLHRQTKDAAE